MFQLPVQQLAEIGVMLLIFDVGLHFSLSYLIEVRRISFPGAIVQILLATIFGSGLENDMGMERWLISRARSLHYP